MAPKDHALAELDLPRAARLLPDELVVSVLEFLGLGDLRAAAGVGRQFYEAAWRAGLYIQRTVLGDGKKDLEGEAQTWTELVDHAVRKNLLLAFTFHCTTLDGSLNERSLAVQMLEAIKRSLPIVIALSVNVDSTIFSDVCAALQHPAPRLRSLYLSPATWGTAESTAIPTGLFSGHAPRLCELGLGRPNTESPAIRAFANVARFSTYSWHNDPPFRLGLLFPKLSHLYVRSGGDEPSVPAPCIDLAGLTLRSLVFMDTRPFVYAAAMRKFLAPRNVPAVHHLLHQSSNMDWHRPLGWADNGGTIHVRVNVMDLGLSILIAPADGSWRRSYSFQRPGLYGGLPLCDMPGASARLAYLRLHSEAALPFLQSAAVFTSLARVRVDAPPACGSPVLLFHLHERAKLEREAEPRVRCPALAVLALAAQERAIVTVEFRDVAVLCRALGPAAKPALELCGVAVECDRGTTLGDLFSRVSHLPDGDGMPCSQFDSGVWDDHAAIVSDDYLRQSLAR